MSRLKLFLPLLIFVVAALLFTVILQKRETQSADFLPSALIGKAFPAFSLPSLYANPANADGNSGDAPAARILSDADLPGRTFLVNIWGTWCPECYREHGILLELAEEGVPIVGINYKDERDKAEDYLARFDNPFVLNVFDSEGTLGLDLGVYGAPETFVVDSSGIIRERVAGGIDRAIWEQRLAPFFGSD